MLFTCHYPHNFCNFSCTDLGMKKYLLTSKIIPLSDVKMQEKEFAITNLLLIPALKN